MALTAEQVSTHKRLKGLVESGMADDGEQELYRRLDALVGQSGNGSAPAEAAPSAGGTTRIKVDVDTFDAGWSTGGSTPPDHDAILSGVCDGFELGRNDPDSIFFHFHADGLKSDDKGFWRGTMMADKISARDGRAGKVKDLLSALGATYRIESGYLEIPDLKGRKCDCDWQTVDVRGQKQRRIQGVYAPGARQQSV